MLGLLLVLMLGALACARADCDACVAGYCHERIPLIRGFRVTDQLAVDRTNNVLYVQLNSNLNTAFFLDELRIELVQMMYTSGMAVDQDTQTLYTGSTVENVYYKYNLTSNTTEAQAVLCNNCHIPIFLEHMFYGNSGLNFVNKRYTSVHYVNKLDGHVWHYKQLEKYAISDFVMYKSNFILFVSNNTIYMYNSTTDPPSVIAKNNHVVSVDKHGDVYLVDESQKVIYKRDSTTGDLDIYASYQSGSVEDFVFERDNNIVFRDKDGSVAQWVPAAAPAQVPCVLGPTRNGFPFNQIDDSTNQMQQ